jgi:GNAT superfamily N-acetyltransferase
MEIRQATPADWPRIYRFWFTIVNAYPEGLTADQAEPLWMERPPAHTVVAVDGADVLGSAKMGPNRPGRGAHIATASFMVDPAHAGRGVGRQLGEYMIGWAGLQGYHAIQFNAVVETNVSAVRLWQALGFQILCTVPEAFDHHTNGLVGLHVMYRKI